MGTDAFYATAAQVMPTLLIALVVEVGYLMRTTGRAVSELRRHLEEEHRREAGSGAYGYIAQPNHPAEIAWLRWGLTSITVFWTFTIGEVLAVLALGFRWFNAWTFFPILICMFVLIVLAAALPTYRNTEEASPPPVKRPWQNREEASPPSEEPPS
ncbi:hypothetical protein [Nonomuraea sp. NPDC023979]|uniref:hypothetical protein n=1 Tax=Nonomuraea sp. NPDC023979 TaxID=3154796 RepID=UPI0033F02A76